MAANFSDSDDDDYSDDFSDDDDSSSESNDDIFGFRTKKTMTTSSGAIDDWPDTNDAHPLVAKAASSSSSSPSPSPSPSPAPAPSSSTSALFGGKRAWRQLNGAYGKRVGECAWPTNPFIHPPAINCASVCGGLCGLWPKLWPGWATDRWLRQTG